MADNNNGGNTGAIVLAIVIAALIIILGIYFLQDRDLDDSDTNIDLPDTSDNDTINLPDVNLPGDNSDEEPAETSSQ